MNTKKTKAMTNNKQHNPIDWLSNQFYELLEQYSQGDFDRITFNELMLAMTYKGREMYQDKIEAAIIKQCAKQSTSEANKYAEGYKEGYKRAIENAKYQINKWIDKELKITQQ
jgi:predicted HTH transcriptional regulator